MSAGIPSWAQVIERFPALESLTWKSERVPFVAQMSSSECGVACLLMVLRYFGRDVSMERLRNEAVSPRDATNAQTLLEIASRYGLLGRAVSVDVDQLSLLEAGAILHWEFKHFVVLERARSSGAVILDPRIGRRFVQGKELGAKFTGVALLFEPAVHFERGKRASGGTRRYLSALLREAKLIPGIVGTSLILQFLGLWTPIMTVLVVDTVIPSQSISIVSLMAATGAAICIFQAFASLVRSYMLVVLRTRLDASLTLGFVAHLMALPMEFFQRRSVGDLMIRINSNATVRDTVTTAAVSTLLDGGLAVVYLFVLVVVSPKVAAVATVCGVLQGMLFVALRHRQTALAIEAVDAQARSSGFLMEALVAMEMLKTLGADTEIAARWSNYLSRDLGVSMRRAQLDAMGDSLGTAIRMTTSLALLLVGATESMSGRLTVGEMLAAVAVAAAFLGPLGSLMAAATRLQVLSVHLLRIQDVLESKTEQEAQQVPTYDRRVVGDVVVDDVYYRYGPVAPCVLSGVSFQAGCGECVAIVGKSGSGKSTLARLLVGIYHPSQGDVRLDGYSLRKWELQAARHGVGFVTQATQMFAGTVKQNILIGAPDAGDAEVVSAAVQACIHDDIVQMPMQYETPVGSIGAFLSGGQIQRLALARALIRQPRLLILDEATSHLDVETEQAVLASIAALKCTRVIVAHRLSTVASADRIVVLNEGKVEEMGCHDQLLELRGRYAGMVATMRHELR